MPGMDKVAVVNALRGREADFHKLGVDALYLFGSTAADKQRGDSDVDLFCDYSDPHFSLLELAGAQILAEEILGRSVDMLTRNSLDPAVRTSAESVAVRVF